ncbi:MAG: hypothetical protein D6683_02195, partial [Actinomyces sp.]
EWIRVGRALRSFPIFDEAFASRRLSYAKVRILTRFADPRDEEELADLARRVSADRLGAALAGWSQGREDPIVRDARLRASRYLVTRVEPDGAVVGTFRLPPADAAVVMAAIDAEVARRARSGSLPRHDGAGDTGQVRAASRDGASAGAPVEGGDASAGASGTSETAPVPGGDASAGASRGSETAPVPGVDAPTLAQQRADALVVVCRDGGAGVDTEIVIHVRGDGCHLDDGTPLTDTVVERLAPTAFLRALIHDAEGRPVDASSRRRHPSVRQKRVVKERDRVCVDCGRSDLLEYDHDPPFEITGRTVVDELVLRCAPCHRRRHAEGGR